MEAGPSRSEADDPRREEGEVEGKNGKGKREKRKWCASVTAAEETEGFYNKMGFKEVGRANVGPLSQVEGGAVMFCDEP